MLTLALNSFHAPAPDPKSAPWLESEGSRQDVAHSSPLLLSPSLSPPNTMQGSKGDISQGWLQLYDTGPGSIDAWVNSVTPSKT